ncbi:MAG: hypothetical protein HQ565_01430, partial [Bacteroidetes bacterium]|nr:hypothetical protein [Bacteroidota bacterium]
MLKKIILKLYHKPPKYFVDHVRIRRLRAKSKTIFKKYLEGEGDKKLQIGCGNNAFDGWLNTDLTYKKDEIAYLDAGKRFPLPDE